MDLNNGVRMPALGLGVFLSPPEQTAEAVRTAIENGYRLVDTAAVYNNERQVGEGIRRSGIARAEMFVTTKLWIRDYGYEPALRAFAASLRRLGLDYVDLFLLHWPVPSDFGATVAAYKAAEKMLVEGRARAIGVSNFNPRHLDELIRRTDVIPALNQVELHPYFIQQDVRGANARHGIATQSWSPIGGVYQRHPPVDPQHVSAPLDNPVIVELASRYAKTPAQIILRWHIEHGLSAVPKSVRRRRIVENIDIVDFMLAPEDIAAIDSLDTGVRSGPDPELLDDRLRSLKVED
jgi:diketogulonate reductase-like aldo/keto reductase